MLHARLLPHPAYYPPTSLLYAPVIELANISTFDEPRGIAGHVEARADEFLVGIGYEKRLGNAWVRRGGVTDWGSSAWMGNGSTSSALSAPANHGFTVSTTTVSQGQEHVLNDYGPIATSRARALLQSISRNMRRVISNPCGVQRRSGRWESGGEIGLLRGRRAAGGRRCEAMLEAFTAECWVAYSTRHAFPQCRSGYIFGLS